MWHEHGERDLDWMPEMQAERRICAEKMGQAAMYVVSVEAICNEEYVNNGFVSEESKAKRSEAHEAYNHIIRWLLDVNGTIHEAER